MWLVDEVPLLKLVRQAQNVAIIGASAAQSAKGLLARHVMTGVLSHHLGLEIKTRYLLQPDLLALRHWHVEDVVVRSAKNVTGEVAQRVGGRDSS